LDTIFDTERSLGMWSPTVRGLDDTRQTLLGMKEVNKVVTVRDAVKAAEVEKEIGNG
jgi:hypothetical protein